MRKQFKSRAGETTPEGVVTGWGLVNGRPVVAFAEDYMAMVGTLGEYHGLKEVRAIRFAKEMGWPVVGMNDSGGARLQEGMDTLETYGILFRTQIQASGIRHHSPDSLESSQQCHTETRLLRIL